MNLITTEQVYSRMIQAIDNIGIAAQKFNWEDEKTYAQWLAQSFFYVSWTTRQLALASARTKPGQEDTLHWRFIEEASEEKKHELLALHDLKNLGYSISLFEELPHTSFFYQSLNYVIEREHPVALMGFSLTLEGFAAQKISESYQRAKKSHGENCVSFLKVHSELDVEHFQNALPHLESCPKHLLPLISKSIGLCEAIYCGILNDITAVQQTKILDANSPALDL